MKLLVIGFAFSFISQAAVLKPQVIKLQTEIEKGYGKKVSIVYVQLSDAYSRTTVLPDGTPEIQLLPGANSNEALTHELLHLKFLLKGYPMYGWYFSDNQPLPP